MLREWHGTGPEDQEQLRKMNDVLEKFLVDSQDCDSVTEDCLDCLDIVVMRASKPPFWDSVT